MMKKSMGFTLTEILVALGIVGVISAMTVPTLTQNWQKRAHTTQLHKVYTEFQQAFTKILSEKNTPNLYEADLAITSSGAGSSVRNFLHDNFKVVKDCGQNSSSGCFGTSYHTIDGSTVENNPSFTGYNVLLASGAAVAFSTVDNSGTDVNNMTYGRIIVDVNGNEGPNVAGRDLFTMQVFPDGVLDALGVDIDCRINSTGCPNSTIRATRENLFSSCRSSITSTGCFGKILNDNWVMNY